MLPHSLLLLIGCLLGAAIADEQRSLRGTNPVCELCRDGSYPKDPNKGVVSLFFDGPRKCSDLYNMGQNREITDQLCGAVQAFMDQPCGCFFMTAPSPVAQLSSWTASTPTGSSWGLAPPSPGFAPAPVPVPIPAPIPAPVPSPIAVGWTRPAPTSPNISWGSPKKVAKEVVDCGSALKCTNNWTGEPGYFMHGFSAWGCYDTCRPIRLASSSMECGMCE